MITVLDMSVKGKTNKKTKTHTQKKPQKTHSSSEK